MAVVTDGLDREAGQDDQGEWIAGDLDGQSVRFDPRRVVATCTAGQHGTTDTPSTFRANVTLANGAVLCFAGPEAERVVAALRAWRESGEAGRVSE